MDPGVRIVRLLSLLLAWLLVAPAARAHTGRPERSIHPRAIKVSTRRPTTMAQRVRGLAPVRASRLVEAKAFAPTEEARAIVALPAADPRNTHALGPLASYLPAGSRARRLPLDGFVHEGVELGIDLSRQRVGIDGPVQVDLALPVLDYARERIGGPARRAVKTVLVPMAGYDAGSAARLFPDAETIIGVEARPFLDRARAGRIVKYASLRSSNYTHWQAIEDMQHLAPAVLSSLAWAVPGFRLRGVTIFSTPGQDAGNSAAIEFDGGPGTPMRRYLHLQEWFPHELPKGAKAPWWWRGLEAHRPDAVIVKGSQDWQRYASTAGVRHTIRTWLKGGGVLVEGDGEFTDAERSPRAVAEADARTVRGATPVEPVSTTKLDDVRFGYGGLRATTF